MINDFFIIFSWWFLLSSLGIIFLPLAWFFFRDFLDFGYPFAKIIGILLLSYFVWLLGSLKILPFSVPVIWLTLLVLASASFVIFQRHKEEITKKVKASFNFILFEEIVFFLALTFWSFVRGFQPDIEGLEKFMDFGFVNSILQSQYFPPLDMWMSGATINYYYFGHLVTAVLTKLSGIDSAITYNLMMASLFALTFTSAFSLGSNLFFSASKKFSVSVVAGLLSSLLLTIGGNFHTLYWFLTNHFSFENYWYPDATRFITEKFGALDNTIHEFPIYSFVVSDLHGHVSNIPFVLLFLALLFSFFTSYPRLSHHTSLVSPLTSHFSLIALSLAVMYMTNAWDFPIYLSVLGLVTLYLNYQKYGLSLKMFFKTCLFTIYYLLFAILFSLPFHLNFSQIAQGLDFVHARSPYWMLFVLWGFPWIIGLSFIIFLVFKKRHTSHFALLPSDIYILILFSIATLLVIIPEFLYVKDIYIPSYHRANTMFKLTYQSFMLYALASGYILVRLWLGIKKWSKFPLFTIYSLLFALIMVYPYFAIKSYYGTGNYRGLSGLNFLKNDPDLPAILWLKENVKNQAVILEAAGDSYTLDNRVSAITGLPTIEGWLVHEWLWRGSFDEPGKRSEEVKTIYESQDLNSTRLLLQKYQVSFVFVGTRERLKYKIAENKFKALGTPPVFENGNTKIYQVGKINN